MTLLHFTYLGIGKTNVVKAPEAGNRLSHLGNPMASLEGVLCGSAAFVAAYYGQKCEVQETMTDVHYKYVFPRQDKMVHAYYLAPYPANVVGLIDVLIEWQKRMMLLMMSSSVEMMKIIEMRKIISFAIE